MCSQALVLNILYGFIFLYSIKYILVLTIGCLIKFANTVSSWLSCTKTVSQKLESLFAKSMEWINGVLLNRNNNFSHMLQFLPTLSEPSRLGFNTAYSITRHMKNHTEASQLLKWISDPLAPLPSPLYLAEVRIKTHQNHIKFQRLLTWLPH